MAARHPFERCVVVGPLLRRGLLDVECRVLAGDLPFERGVEGTGLHKDGRGVGIGENRPDALGGIRRVDRHVRGAAFPRGENR